MPKKRKVLVVGGVSVQDGDDFIVAYLGDRKFQRTVEDQERCPDCDTDPTLLIGDFADPLDDPAAVPVVALKMVSLRRSSAPV